MGNRTRGTKRNQGRPRGAQGQRVRGDPQRSGRGGRRQATRNSPQTSSMMSTQQTTCLVCCEPREVWAVSACEHKICGVCSLRRRQLYHQYECCYCKANQDDGVVLTSSSSSQFSALSSKLPTYSRLAHVPGVYFETENIRDEMAKLCGSQALRCQICIAQPGFLTLHMLKEHMKKHGLHYCPTCLTHNKVFAFACT